MLLELKLALSKSYETWLESVIFKNKIFKIAKQCLHSILFLYSCLYGPTCQISYLFLINLTLGLIHYSHLSYLKNIW